MHNVARHVRNIFGMKKYVTLLTSFDPEIEKDAKAIYGITLETYLQHHLSPCK